METKSVNSKNCVCPKRGRESGCGEARGQGKLHEREERV